MIDELNLEIQTIRQDLRLAEKEMNKFLADTKDYNKSLKTIEFHLSKYHNLIAVRNYNLELEAIKKIHMEKSI